MITAETLRQCAWLSSAHIEKLLNKSFPHDKVVQSNFIGITNGGQFCYDISFPDEDTKSGLGRGKVFVWQDANGEVVAEY